MNDARSVLIVDDDTDVRDAVAALFEVRGWRAIKAEDGDEGFSMAVEHLPDLVVLDVMMPIQDGFVTLQRLRDDTRTAHMPVIMLTAINEVELSTHHDAESIGATAGVEAPEFFLEKPVDATALSDVLTQIFD